MSVRSAPPLTLTLKLSRRLAWALSVGYGLAAVACIANPLAWWLRALALMAVSIGAVISFRQHIGAASRITQLRISETGEWTLWTAGGDEAFLTLSPSSIVTPWLILLHFRDENRRFRAVTVMPDSLEADGFRRLTVRLRSLTFEQALEDGN